MYKFFIFILCSSLCFAYDLKTKELYNKTAFITSQCYTKTLDAKGNKHNPCYACHTKATKPNFVSDEDLQEAYSFPEYATKNRWTNLFKDRTLELSKISDAQIAQYIKQDNYKDKNGDIKLVKKLRNVPQQWDYNNDKKWNGYVPDCYFNFNTDGFDIDKQGNLTGWIAYKYYPFLGTFWPTNGSTDDVLIRLPKVFWMDKNNKFDLNIYKQNLQIVSELITQTKEHTNYVGLAGEKNLHIAPGLFPVGTEFLHSVRYIQPTKGGVGLSARMKELRYAKKTRWATYYEHQTLAEEDFKEKYDFPDRYGVYLGDMENGLSNKRGWIYQGFIEDAKGELRPQNYEETLYCIGCHSNIGAITDSTFSFPRLYKWGAWDKKGLKGMLDKNNEYTNYLKNNNHANEFRTNEEVYNKFFKDGKPNLKEIAKIKNDISYLLVPSHQRAIGLNKAYKIIVDEQSYIYGREGHIKPLGDAVHTEVKQDEPTHLEVILKH